MRFIIDVSKLHVWSCIHHFNCFSGVRFMESSDKDIKRSGLESEPIRQHYFNCCLVVLKYFWWRSYNITYWSKELSGPVLSNTPVYIAIVSIFELILEVSDFFLAHLFMMVPLKRQTVYVNERVSEIFTAWYASRYVWRKLEYSLFLLISACPALK